MPTLLAKPVRMKNSRRFKRIRAAYLMKYQIGSQEPRVTNVQDISAGGLRFWTTDPIPESSVLNIHIYLPPLNRTVEAVAQVLRVRKAKDSPLYYVGTCFLDLKKQDREAINQFAEALAGDKETQFAIDHAEVVVRKS